MLILIRSSYEKKIFFTTMYLSLIVKADVFLASLKQELLNKKDFEILEELVTSCLDISSTVANRI